MPKQVVKQVDRPTLSRRASSPAASASTWRASCPEGDTPAPFVWDEARRARLRAELDALHAHLYGLTRGVAEV